MNEQERAAMQQALEALERLQNAIYNIGGEHVTGLYVANDAADSAEKPMGALRAALAQQPEPVQEPVATPWKAMYELAIEQRTKAKAQRDALLEALDQCLNGTLIGGHTHNDNGLEVLAQRCGAPHIANELRRLANIARAALAQQPEPAQEPVAWIQPDHLQKARVAPFLCRVEPTPRCADFVPLYTAPHQRPPLTDEEIQELSQQHKFDSRMEKFVRIIERKVRGETE